MCVANEWRSTCGVMILADPLLAPLGALPQSMTAVTPGPMQLMPA